MEIQQQTSSALLASNVSTIVSSQNKSKTPLLSASPTSIITVITSRSYGIASLSSQLGVMLHHENNSLVISHYKE
jgi:hypothetical protein